MTTTRRASCRHGRRPAVDRNVHRRSSAGPRQPYSWPSAVGRPVAVIGRRPWRPQRSIRENKIYQENKIVRRQTWWGFTKTEMSADLANARSERGGHTLHSPRSWRSVDMTASDVGGRWRWLQVKEFNRLGPCWQLKIWEQFVKLKITVAGWPWPSKNSSWFCFGENTLLNTFSCTPRWVLTTKFCFWSVLSNNISVLTYS